MKGGTMSDLLKKLEDTEVQLKDRADQCESLKAELAAGKLEVVEAHSAIDQLKSEVVKLTAERDAVIAKEQAAIKRGEELAKEVETLKEKLALGLPSKVGAGAAEPLPVGVAADGKIDHHAEYSKINDPKARQDYRNKYRKELGLK